MADLGIPGMRWEYSFEWDPYPSHSTIHTHKHTLILGGERKFLKSFGNKISTVSKRLLCAIVDL